MNHTLPKISRKTMHLMNPVSKQTDGLKMIRGNIQRYNNKGETLDPNSLFAQRKSKYNSKYTTKKILQVVHFELH